MDIVEKVKSYLEVLLEENVNCCVLEEGSMEVCIIEDVIVVFSVVEEVVDWYLERCMWVVFIVFEEV